MSDYLDDDMTDFDLDKYVAIILELDPDYFDSGARTLAKAMLNKKTVMLTSARWDNDSREIWQIPEARDLFIGTCAAAIRVAGKQALIDCLMPQSIAVLDECVRAAGGQR